MTGEITADPINITKLTTLCQLICQLKQNGKFLGCDNIPKQMQEKFWTVIYLLKKSS